jgi:threonine aldolase
MGFIDLRSDTVTHPTPEMRKAMADAEVGDDVFGEDPTINRLQEMAADMLGKEAGLLVPSGTMGNLAAILTHCTRGDEVILGKWAHTYLFEAGGISALGGVHSCQVPNQPDGTIKLEDILSAIRADDIHQPVTRLVTIENTHNRCGGAVLTPEYTRSAGDLTKAHGLKLHIDGARIFNAAASLGVKVSELTAPADSITFCLSKGLCAPVGSVLVGSKQFIEGARRIRKQLGGGMRQAGVLAAAGIIALEKMVDRLTEDHERARCLADGLRQIPGIRIDPGSPHTNMVFFNMDGSIPFDAEQAEEKLKGYGILTHSTGERRFRLVTHYWIGDEDVTKAVDAIRKVFKG